MIHFTKKCLPALIINITLSGMATLLSIDTEAVQASTVKIIARDDAINNTTSIPIWPGRSTFIDFSQTNEVITYILLADPSRTVFSTDAPLASRQAKTIFLKEIKPLRFPGATSTEITNLTVKTRSIDGKERLYSFDIVPNSGQATTNGITLVPLSPSTEQKILVSGNRVATLNDVELGLAIAINKGYTKPNDPVVFKVKNFLALARNLLPISLAAQKAKLSLNVVTALGEIGIQQRLHPQIPGTTI